MNIQLNDVQGPFDFPPSASAPGLSSLDESLRCTICGELFDAPVTLSCGHCFCSCCVRSALLEKQLCPKCQKETKETNLRPNPVMEEAVAAWKVARSYVLRLSWNDHQGVPSSPPTNGVRTHKKRRHNESSSNSAEEFELRLVSPQRTKSKAEDNPRPPHGWRPLGQRKQNDGTVPSSDIDEIEMTAETLKDEFVTCPLCNASVKLKRINEHMDRNCDQLGSVEQAGNKNSKQKEWGKIMGQSGKGKAKASDSDDDAFPLPKASYGTLKDKKIREMLSEHGLPTHGERSACIQRHQRWVILYNANLDRAVAHRKTKGELRKDLKRWEDERNKKSKTVVDDIMVYEKNNKSEFARLIEAARSRQVTKSAYFNPDTMTPSTSNKPPTILPQPEDASPIVVDSQDNN